MAKIKAMAAVEFAWKANGQRDIGFIAQQIEPIQPELVGSRGDMKTLDYAKFAPLLVAAIQELSEQIQQLKKE